MRAPSHANNTKQTIECDKEKAQRGKQRRDSTDGRAAALYPADQGSNPVVSAACLTSICFRRQADPTNNE